MIDTGDYSTTLINPGSYFANYIHPVKIWCSTINRDGSRRENQQTPYFFFSKSLYTIEKFSKHFCKNQLG
jgi:hypothetical protein